MPWYFYFAFKQLFPTNKWISSFSLISIIGVSLGVSVLIIVQSVMNGFGENIRSHLSQTYGDINITSRSGLIDDWENISYELSTSDKSLCAIGHFEPYLETIVMLQTINKTAFPIIRGIETSQERSFRIKDERAKKRF